MKKILLNIGKLVAFLLLSLALWFLSYFAYTYLYCIFAYGDIPSRIDKDVAQVAGTTAGCFMGGILLWLIVLFWSKQARFIKRFLLFAVLYIPLLLCFAFVSNFILGGMITGFVFIPTVYIYQKMITRNITKNIKFIVKGGWLHHHGYERLCIILGLLCIPTGAILYFQNSRDGNIFSMIFSALFAYFVPFLLCYLIKNPIYKIYKWVKSGFTQANS